MITVSNSSIRDNIKLLTNKESDDDFMYASLLRILITPSIYKIEPDMICKIVNAIRDSKNLLAHKRILDRLNEIAPLAQN